MDTKGDCADTMVAYNETSELILEEGDVTRKMMMVIIICGRRAGAS